MFLLNKDLNFRKWLNFVKGISNKIEKIPPQKIYSYKNLTLCGLTRGSYYDLLYLQLECPHKGALKNFFVKYNNNTTWYQFICYSSLQINQMNIL